MKEYTLKIKSALFKADDVVKENYKIIGSEIKSKRLNLAKTLQAVSGNVCSVSYLCKIENNKIIPNRMYLREICKRLDMQNSKIDALLVLKESINKCVKAFFNNDLEAIEECFLNGKSLINYRYKLIELIYYLSIKNYNLANKKVEALMKLCNTMTESDLVVFSAFYGILAFYNQEFEDAVVSLEYAIKFSTNVNIDVYVLAMKYEFFAYMNLDDSSVIFSYNKLIDALVINGFLDKLDEIHFMMAIYLLRAKSLIEYKRVFKLVKKESYRKSLYLLAKLILNPYLRIKISWIENVEPFFYYLGLIKTDFELAKKEIFKLKLTSFSEHFNPIYLQYLVLETDEERLCYINNVILPIIDKTKCTTLSKFIVNEVSKISKRNSKYKMFLEFFRKLNGIVL